jgi:D-psicose/D-tagatose/L-ribulose 3-epimerase
MKLGLIEAVWSGSPLEGRPGAELAKEIGFDSIDLVADPLDLDQEQLSRVVADAEAVGLPVSATVCVALGIADFNRSVQRFHVDRAKRHLDFAAGVGASNMLLVIGDYLWKKEVIAPGEQWETAVTNVREVATHAESLGLLVALELEPYEWAYVNSIDEMVRFLDAVGAEAMMANADLAHLWPMNIHPDELQKLTGRIAHAHISDCDGVVYENLPPGRGTAPLAAYYRALEKTGFDGTIALELEPPPHGVDVTEWVREGYERTKELMEKPVNAARRAGSTQ